MLGQLISALPGVGQVLGGLSGLFGKKEKQPTPAENIVSQAQGAREAAEKYGFNPLTMLQYGQPGGAMASAGGPAPLASVEMLTSGLRDFNDVVSGDAARRRQADILEMDLAKLKLDQARSGVLLPQSNTVDRIGSAPSVLGRRPAIEGQSNVTAANPPLSRPVGLAPGRKVEVDPVKDTAGVSRITNSITGPEGITIPGEGEPWGLDELATAAVVGIPQILWNRVVKPGLKAREEIPETLAYQKKPPSRRRHSLHNLGFK